MRFTKKLLTAALVLTLVVGLVPNVVMANSVTATPSAHQVMVDGELVALRAFLINDENFFMLRDIAYTLSGTPSQFEVTWDEERSAINLLTGAAYTPVGGEMQDAPEGDAVASPSTAVVYVDGTVVDLLAFNINDNNFFRLRDLGDALGFEVDWDAEAQTVLISTDVYVAAPIVVEDDEDEPADDEADADEEPADEPDEDADAADADDNEYADAEGDEDEDSDEDLNGEEEDADAEGDDEAADDDDEEEGEDE